MDAHKDRATKFFHAEMGECVCVYCKALPWHEGQPVPATPQPEGGRGAVPQVRVNLLCPKGHQRGIKLTCDCDGRPSVASEGEPVAEGALAQYPDEAVIGRIIREASGWESGKPFFTLNCSVGELAQRIASVLHTRPASGTPAVTSEVVAGALFDFAGYLTTLAESYTIGEKHDASRMVEELRIWARTRGLPLEPADVMQWTAALRTERPDGN